MAKFIEIGRNFWNIRGSYRIFCGLIEIGTQMSMIRLSNNRFLLLDTVPIDAIAKTTFDQMTDHGRLIEGIVATHPFHTSSWPSWYHWYPNTHYYGTPRHYRLFPDIPWIGDVSDPITQQLWEREGIFMKIPDGSTFDPEDESNHFSSLFVYHSLSRTLHISDTLTIEENPNLLLRCFGIYPGYMRFWPLKKGLRKSQQAPKEFQEFMEIILDQWDFDNLVVAHRGVKIGGAKEEVRKLLNSSRQTIDRLSEK